MMDFQPEVSIGESKQGWYEGKARDIQGTTDILQCRIHNNLAERSESLAEYTAEILWFRGDQEFLDKRYSRRHLLRFDGGIDVPGSSSPQVVPLPYSDPAAVDPEEAFVASLSSCHMLWFLSIAAQRGFVIDSYRDVAVGLLAKNSDGKLAMTRVTLRPIVQFSSERWPSRAEQQQMHEQAHEDCFIANSVKTDVRCEPDIPE